MPRAKRPCQTPGCPALIEAGRRRCTDCAAKAERIRGTRQQRGYDARHDRERRRVARTVIGTPCARCGQPIQAGEPWHLDHTDDRTAYLGPSHERCNTSAGGRAAHDP